mgnify:CR=1 FL=1
MSRSIRKKEEIEGLESITQERPEKREAQKALARAMTDLIHGESATQEAERASEILFGGNLDGITEQTFNDVLGEVPTVTAEKSEMGSEGFPLVNALALAGLAPSKGQARKDIKGGGANLNNQREQDPQRIITEDDLLFDKHILLRKGKKHYAVITFR